ncbi:MAG: hypothetical protein Q8O14_02855 [bacterium]|nr:hypothetical protein [bacterium]
MPKKPITYNEFVIQAKLYLIRNTGNLLGKRDFDVFDYDELTRQVFDESFDFSWFLDFFEEAYPYVLAGFSHAEVISAFCNRNARIAAMLARMSTI